MASENGMRQMIASIIKVHRKTGKIPQDIVNDFSKELRALRKTNPEAATRVKKAYEGWVARQTNRQIKAKAKKKEPAKSKSNC